MINRRTLKTELGVFADFQPELPESFRDAPFVLLGNIVPRLQLHLLEQARGKPFVAVDTMDYWIHSAREDLEKVIRRADLLTVNDGEARQLTGAYNLREAARKIMALGPRFVVVKKGEHGSMLISQEGIALIPAYPLERVVDPTGAGDAFAGGFMGFLARTGAARIDDALMRRALLYGSVTASFGVEAFSTERLETLTLAEITARADELRRMATL
jgi:sugar/nucleoside kinase (ribokinase family)